MKIGHPFTTFGWPQDYKNHQEPILTVSRIRDLKSELPSLKDNILVGGHTFLGLESFMPGVWDLWMNYREPVSRLNSGILRFHSRPRKQKSGSKSGHLIDLEKSYAVNLEDPHDIDVLLETSLRRENNGICRRLGAMSLASKFTHGADENIETIDIISTYRYSSDDLFSAARANLDRLSILINSEFFHHSILCIEREYNMKSPLINPFSDLRHNPVELAGISKGDSRVLNNCRNILEKHCSADLRLYPLLNKKFAQQVNRCQLTDSEVEVRNLIHRKPLSQQNGSKSLGSQSMKQL